MGILIFKNMLQHRNNLKEKLGKKYSLKLLLQHF